MLQGMPTPTKLSGAIASKTAPPAPPVNHRFEQALQSGRVSIPYVIPGIELSCLMFVVGSDKQLELEGKANELMELRGFELTDETADKFELCRAWHILSHACRDDAPELQPNPPPIGTVEHWGRLSPAVVAAVWLRFLDLCTQYDPLADRVKLTEGEFIGIRDSLKKKRRSSVACLRATEAHRLHAYYGVPAIELTDTQIRAWGLIAGIFKWDALDSGGGSSYVNSAYREDG